MAQSKSHFKKQFCSFPVQIIPWSQPHLNTVGPHWKSDAEADLMTQHQSRTSNISSLERESVLKQADSKEEQRLSKQQANTPGSTCSTITYECDAHVSTEVGSPV